MEQQTFECINFSYEEINWLSKLVLLANYTRHLRHYAHRLMYAALGHGV